MELTRLFSTISINGMNLKNRIVMPAIHHLYTPDGFATDQFNQYYWTRAEGGAGLIFVGGCRFDDYGGSHQMMSLQTDAFIHGYKVFTDGMHARGAKVGVQLYHAGRYAHQAAIPGGKQALAPSAVYSDFTKETPKEMTVGELKEIIKNWAAGAARAQKAGFDIVEIIGSAGYLIAQFLSPVTNLRTDEYGGSWENRTRFARELVVAIRQVVGLDYPICMRIGGNDFMNGSNTSTEAVAFCKLMEACGIDMLNVTGGWHETSVPQLSGDVSRGGYTYLAIAIKDAVGIPVAASNRISSPVLAEKILAMGSADLICVGRPLIADPDWANKAKAGTLDEIRYCLACNQGCLAKAFFMKPIECLVNGKAGREYLYKEFQPEKSLQILIVGAGPAGCEFAVQAAKLGHKVTVWEKAASIGGQLGKVAVLPGKSEFGTLIGYYETMLKKYGISIVLEKTAYADEIAESSFDAVVTATGILPNAISLPGNSPIPVVNAYEILENKVAAGKDVIILGGGTVGCETAQYLAHEASLSPEQVYFLLEHKAETVEKVLAMMNECRRRISVIDIVKIGNGFEPGTGWPIMKDMKRLGIKLLPFTELREARNCSVLVAVNDKKTKTVSEITIPCDTIVLSVGARPNNGLYESLKEKHVNVYNIGDSNKVGKVLDGIRDAVALSFAID